MAAGPHYLGAPMGTARCTVLFATKVLVCARFQGTFPASKGMVRVLHGGGGMLNLLHLFLTLLTGRSPIFSQAVVRSRRRKTHETQEFSFVPINGA